MLDSQNGDGVDADAGFFSESTRVVVSKYKIPPALEGAPPFRRVAHFFNWMAEKAPRHFIPPAYVTQAVTGVKKPPHARSQDIVIIRGTYPRARRLLVSEYKRELLSMRGGNGDARATVDDDEKAEAMKGRFSRFNSAGRNLAATSEIIDVSKVVDPTLRGFAKETAAVVKSFGTSMTGSAVETFRLLVEKSKSRG